MSTEFEERGSKRTQTYRQLGQGLKIFHDPPHADVDILAIPGLGANPIDCWTYNSRVDTGRSKTTVLSLPTDSPASPRPASETNRTFNWLRDADGLASIFPTARIMLYDYASAWQGNRKVRATMRSICTWLLDDLSDKRKDGVEITRPLIFIGHSMGGIVIAKTLCMAKARREYEAIVTCTMGCVFFGAPFKGSEMAKVALLYTSVFGSDAYESLLSFMRTEKNDTLDELVNDFMEIGRKLVPPIDLVCAYEQVATDVAYAERTMGSPKMSNLMQHKFFRAGAKTLLEVGYSVLPGEHFVEMESAVLPGSHPIGLTTGHSDLIRFKDITSERFIPVKTALTSMVQMARVNARKRTSGQNLLSQKFLNQVRQSLEGVDMRHRFRAKVGERQIASWLTSEPRYQEWLGADAHCPHLWLKGGPGLGKTYASLAAIQKISKIQLDEQQTVHTPGRNDIFLAYFLCDSSSGCTTAEDVLKSLITQIINQEESLAQHARWFVPNPRYRGVTINDNNRVTEETSASSAKATATVDNLWQCLQDVIEDPVVNSIHIIVSNIHCLDASDSTNALLFKLRENALALGSIPPAARRARWLVTSRNDRHISRYLTAECISVIDLENSEYGSKVKGARLNHTKDAVIQLRKHKNYSLDLASYVRNFIESQSEDVKWTDVLCLLLGAMPNDSSKLFIRNWLREVGNLSINKLVDHAWDKILRQNEDVKPEIEELLHALTIAYEPPTLADLAVLTQIEDERLTKLIQKCSPIIQMGESSEHKNTIIFAHTEFRDCLFMKYHGQIEQRKRYHGLMAFQCFSHIKTSYDVVDQSGHSSESYSSLVRSSTITTRVIKDTNILVVTNEDEELDEATTAAPETSALTCYYPIKYLYRHLSEGFPDVAQELCEDDPDFWGRESSLRSGWLKDFQVLTSNLKEVNTQGMSALHVAAGIGANELVSILVIRNGQAALSWTNDDGMTALHIAAHNNHLNVVDTLIRAGASIEAGEGNAGTALHCAALQGNCSIIAFLIEKGANVNAFGRDLGPVINAAILSGTVDAVKQIMDRDVRFDHDYTKCDPPLSLAARIPEPALFSQILETGKKKWQQNVKLLDQALNSASYSGRLESVRILLNFPHVYLDNTIESSIRTAANERNWASVIALLDYAIKDTPKGNRRDIKLTDVFYLAATNREERLDVLEKIWDFPGHAISLDVLDFSLYQATVLMKNSTAVWLLETCKASPHATAKLPASLAAEYATFAPTADFWNALNAAASTGNAFLAKWLIYKGAEVDSDRCYALQLAASEGHVEVVETLLEHGASVNRQVPVSEELGFFSGTALQAACDRSRERVVEILIKNGADPNLGGGALTNPITAATQRAQPGIFRLLLSAPGIDINVTGGDDKSTPLINAATYMSNEYVELLVKTGAEVNAQNSAGDTALIMAAWRGDKSCVEMLCDAGADVTYRSPHRGLATQVAAEGAHPLCARLLAEKVNEKIDGYRQKVTFDSGTLEERDKTIEELNALLEETKEQLEIAKKDIVKHRLEKARIVSVNALQGQAHQSASQQMKSMRDERVELLKQIDALTGQNELSTDTILEMQELLDEETRRNAALRQRQGYTTLQEEKRVALEQCELAKQVGVEMLEVEEGKREELRSEIQRLQDDVQVAKEDVASAQRAAETALSKAEALKREKEQLQNELRSEKAKAEETQAVVASVLAAASKKPNGAPEVNTAVPAGQQDYFADAGNRGLGKVTESPVSSPALASPSNPAMSPRSPPASPWTSGSERRFTTIHGQHRADGSLGGYRKDRVTRRTMSGNSFSQSVREGSGGDPTSSKDSLQSEARS